MYIYQRSAWPNFTWKHTELASKLAEVHYRQGKLLGRMEALGLAQNSEALLKTFTLDVIKSSEIEGETLNEEQVRSSIAKKLGLDIAGLIPADRRVEGIVQMTLEATQQYQQPLTEKRLCMWHTMLFPDKNYSGKIRVGTWRDDSNGAMQVVSGAMGHERVYYEAPPADRIPAEIETFLKWANTDNPSTDPLLKAAIVHLWFVTIHPFDDGNGRIARTIADWALARAENSARRFYSVSAQIRFERKEYYSMLEAAQKGGLDITQWLAWFLDCIKHAIDSAEESLAIVFKKDHFWKIYAGITLNTRQHDILNRLLEGFEGKLTSSKWAKICKCSQDTASRDIQDLIEKGILQKDTAGGRSTSYSLKPF